MTPEQLLDLIAAKAPRLRAAGVTQVTLEGCAFSLGPDPTPATNEQQAVDDDLDPLTDPETFGRRREMPKVARVRRPWDDEQPPPGSGQGM